MCALVLQNLLWSWALLETQVLVVALATRGRTTSGLLQPLLVLPGLPSPLWGDPFWVLMAPRFC